MNIIQSLIDLGSWSYLFIGLLSVCVGSFLNVVIYRTPKIMEQEWDQEIHYYLHPEKPYEGGEILSLSKPRSTCPSCQNPIKPIHNVPVVGWLFLKGKCHQCKSSISIRYPFVELLTAVLSIAVYHQFGPSWQAIWGIVLTWCLIALAGIDFDTQLLPDRITLPLAGLGLAVNTYSVFTTPTLSIWGYVIGFMCLWLVYQLFKLVTGKEGMGYGDFKLLAALGAWLGVMSIPLIIIMSSFAGAIIGGGYLLIKRQNLAFAFGPYLAIAGWISLMWGPTIMSEYLRLFH